MTSRVSKNKINPALGMFKTTFLKNIGSTVLLSIAMLIFCPGFFIAALSKQTLIPENYSSPDSLSALFGVSTVFSCILVCVANFVNFSYLYKKSSSDVFHALPLTRFSLLISRAAAGFISVLVPVTIGYTALALMTLRYPAFVTGTISQIASSYLMNILFMIVFSAFSMIFIVCAGSGFDLAVSFFGFNISLLIIAAIISSLCSTYLKGFNNFGFLEVISPPYNLIMLASDFATNNYSLAKSGCAILDILLYAFAFGIIGPVLYKFRKAERGEQAYAYKFLYVICGILIGFCGGYGLSQIFVFAVDTKSFTVIGFISFIAGALITTVIYGAVTERGFKGFKQSLLIGGVSVVAYLLTAAIILTGAFGFEKRIPDVDKIAEVKVDIDAEVCTEPENAIALHKAIIDKNADVRLLNNNIDEKPLAYVTLYYTFKGKNKEFGNTLTRSYFVDVTKVKTEIYKIYSSDKRFDAINKIVDTTDKPLEISGVYNENKLSYSVYSNISKAAVKQIVATYKEELQSVGEDYLIPKYSDTDPTDVSIFIENEDFKNECINLSLNKDFPKTNKLIKKYIEPEALPQK